MDTVQVGASQKVVEQRQVTCTKSPGEDVCADHICQHSKHKGGRGDV